MSRIRKIYNVVTGIVMLLLSLLLILDGENSIELIAGILVLSLLVRGIRLILYYFLSARHMIGGLWVLIAAIFLLELSMFTSTMDDYPRLYVILYLLCYHAFSGFVNLMRGLEARRYQSPEWKPNVIHGAFDFLIAMACLVFLRSSAMLAAAYGITLAWSALLRIASAFRRSEVIYIGP